MHAKKGDCRLEGTALPHKTFTLHAKLSVVVQEDMTLTLNYNMQLPHPGCMHTSAHQMAHACMTGGCLKTSCNTCLCHMPGGTRCACVTMCWCGMSAAIPGTNPMSKYECHSLSHLLHYALTCISASSLESRQTVGIILPKGRNCKAVKHPSQSGLVRLQP